jgi:hypothetical protein
LSSVFPVAIFLIVVCPSPDAGRISDFTSKERFATPSLLPVMKRPWTVVQESVQGVFNILLSVLVHELKSTREKRSKGIAFIFIEFRSIKTNDASG